MSNNVVPIGRATGPRTIAGKRRSSLNALKSGLYSARTVIQGVESAEEYRDFARAIVADLGARTTLEMALAERIVAALWRSQRVRRFETEKLSADGAKAADQAERAANGHAMAAKYEAYADAILALRYTGPISPETLLAAVEGFDALYDTGTDRAAERLVCELDTLSYRKRRSRKAVKRILDTAAVAYSAATGDAFALASGRALRKAALELKTKSSDVAATAKKAQTEALILNRYEAYRLNDAERRIDRQLSAALADFERVRNLAPAHPLDAIPETLEA